MPAGIVQWGVLLSAGLALMRWVHSEFHEPIELLMERAEPSANASSPPPERSLRAELSWGILLAPRKNKPTGDEPMRARRGRPG